MFQRTHPALAGLLLAALVGCDGAPPTGALPAPGPGMQLARLDCAVTVASGAMACQSQAPSTGDARGLVVGGQGTYVFLEATNHTYEPTEEVFSIDVTVQNLMGQSLGTTDGATLDEAGVRVLFDVEPYAATGDLGAPVTLLGVQRAFLMRANQAYYQYDEVLSQNETSGAETWEVSLPSSVTSFRFVVYVMAQVQFPDGYVLVTPAADTLLEGTTAVLSTSVVNALGRAVADQTVTWGTSDAGVATVNASGLVTAVAPGTVTLTATQGSRSGSATLAVCPDLDVGEAYTAEMPGAASLCFSGGESGMAEYTYMPVNLSSASALSLSVTGAGIVAVTGPPTPALLPAGPSLLLDPGLARLRPDEDFHMRLMERDRRELQPLAARPDTRVSRRGSERAPGGPRLLITPGVPSVGDLWSLNVALGCTGTLDTRTGRVVSVGQHVVVVADTTNPAGGFTTAQYDSIAAEFDSIAYPVDTMNFGPPTDLDENSRVVAFYTRAVNELTPPASGAVVAGFFTARDLFSSAPASCPKSNEGEIFYMLVPDPTGAVNGNVRTVSYVRSGTVGTMGHELQHLINAARRIYVHETQNFEQVWLNEGLSHIAEELMFYRTSGLAPRGNILLGTLTSGPEVSRRVDAFNRYANPNFGRLRSFLQRPDTAGPVKSNDALATRGAVWAFLRYAADRRNADDATLWYSLVNTTSTGKTNLENGLGFAPDPWVRDFVSALYADDAVAGIAAPQQVTSWSFRSVYSGLGGFPLLARPLTNGVSLTLSYSAGGGTAYTRFGVPAGGFASVTALSGGVAPVSPYALVVVRTK